MLNGLWRNWRWLSEHLLGAMRFGPEGAMPLKADLRHGFHSLSASPLSAVLDLGRWLLCGYEIWYALLRNCFHSLRPWVIALNHDSMARPASAEAHCEAPSLRVWPLGPSPSAPLPTCIPIDRFQVLPGQPVAVQSPDRSAACTVEQSKPGHHYGPSGSGAREPAVTRPARSWA